jgi:hypothetical protein
VFGDWVLAPTDCESGALAGFFGVDLWDDRGGDVNVRVLDDPLLGDTVSVRNGNVTPRIVQREACDIYDVDLALSRRSVRGVRLVKGSLELSCSDGEGGAIEGWLEFGNCKGQDYVHSRPPVVVTSR